MPKNLNKTAEMALFDLAIGCKTSETKTIVKNGEVVEQITIEKKTAPDIKAIKLWLSTMDPEKWGEVQKDDNRVDELLEKINQYCTDYENET